MLLAKVQKGNLTCWFGASATVRETDLVSFRILWLDEKVYPTFT